MGKIYAVGDTHGSFSYLNKLIEDDKPEIIFICGDFGYWRREMFKAGSGFFHNKIVNPETAIYFCDGNHEDHSKLYNLVQKHGWENPIEVQDGIFYCPRGSSLTLEDGRNVLFFGGAKSTDREVRLAYFDWFPEEMISYSEFSRVELDKCYDIVVSHTCPTVCVNRMLNNIGLSMTYWNPDSCCNALQSIYESIKPEKWFFGHWHACDRMKIENTEFIALNMTPNNGCYTNVDV